MDMSSIWKHRKDWSFKRTTRCFIWKDSIGGVINIITKKPSNEWGGSIGAEYMKDNTIMTNLEFRWSFDRWHFILNLGGYFNKTDGWMINSYDGSDINDKSIALIPL